MNTGFLIRLIKLVITYSLASIAIGYRLFGDILFKLNSVQLDHSGDGFKNYFSFAYQYNHGKGLWFEGMQYPYGDLAAYADAQPALVLIMQALRYLGLDIAGKELFFIQALPVLCLVPAGICLHLIMKHYDMPQWWTIITVTICLALSPQLFRFNSHYALAYTFVIPFVWYLFIRYNSNGLQSWKYFSLCFLILLLAGFIHPYLLLVASVFILALFVSNILVKKQIQYTTLLSGLLPIAAFMLINSFIDPYPLRPANPFGIWEYKTELSDMLPFYGWFPDLLSFLPGLRSSYHEGYTYLGTLIFLTPLLGLLIIKRKIQLEKNLTSATLAGLFCLLFAMGIHVLLTGGNILDWLSPLKQFRSLGRFAWAFYYPWFIILSILFYRSTKLLKSAAIRFSLIALVSLIWILDAGAYTRAFNNHIQPYTAPNLLQSDTRLLDALSNNGYSAEDFQAILPLPVPVEGAEKFNVYDNWFVKMLAFPYSFQTATPLTGAYMSRTELPNILKQAQVASSFNIEKELLSDLEDDRDLLVLVAKEDKSLYQDFIQSSYAIAELKEVLVRGTSIEKLSRQNILENPAESRSGVLYYNSFKEEDNEGLLSKGSIRINGQFQLFKSSLDSLTSDSLVFSVWYKIQPEESNVPFFQLITRNEKNEILQDIKYRDRDIKRIEVMQDWIQIKKDIILDPGSRDIEWNIRADNLFVDHSLITISKDAVCIPLENGYFISDHFIAKSKDQ